jgi:glycosyltransferase involved in cell wall biosynthesis
VVVHPAATAGEDRRPTFRPSSATSIPSSAPPRPACRRRAAARPIEARALAAADQRAVFLTDVDDDEKPLLMRGCAAYALPTKEEPDFVETFGIALTEKLLAGGGR